MDQSLGAWAAGGPALAPAAPTAPTRWRDVLMHVGPLAAEEDRDAVARFLDRLTAEEDAEEATEESTTDVGPCAAWADSRAVWPTRTGAFGVARNPTWTSVGMVRHVALWGFLVSL